MITNNLIIKLKGCTKKERTEIKKERTEIKKELYKQKPVAELNYIRKGVAYYDTVIKIEEEPIFKYKTLFFEIAVSDMGDSDFTPKMDAKLLIRWLSENIM